MIIKKIILSVPALFFVGGVADGAPREVIGSRIVQAVQPRSDAREVRQTRLDHEKSSAWLETIAPGFDSIVRNPVEYRRVLDKFSAALVRLSVRDCAIAYYGFPMQEGFSPEVAGEEDMQRAIMADDYETAYALGLKILERAPTNLTALYWTLFAATETRKEWEVRNSLRGRYNSISHIVSLSGDGTASETAFKVVWTGDMYTYTMLELGLAIGNGYLLDNRWTEFEVTPAGPGAKFDRESIFFEVVAPTSNQR